MEPTQLGEPADPFATPLEILPEWYFFPPSTPSRDPQQAPRRPLHGRGARRPHHRPLPGVHQQVPEPLPPPRRHLRLPHRHLLRHLDGHRRHHAHRQGHLPRRLLSARHRPGRSGAIFFRACERRRRQRQSRRPRCNRGCGEPRGFLSIA